MSIISGVEFPYSIGNDGVGVFWFDLVWFGRYLGIFLSRREGRLID